MEEKTFDIAKIFTKVLNTEDGEKLMKYLRKITIERILSYKSDEKELYYVEGQRNLIKLMERLIEKGKIEK